MVVPGRLLELAGPPFGHGTQGEDGDDAHPDGCQAGAQDPHGPGERGAFVGTLEVRHGVADQPAADAGHQDGQERQQPGRRRGCRRRDGTDGSGPNVVHGPEAIAIRKGSPAVGRPFTGRCQTAPVGDGAARRWDGGPESYHVVGGLLTEQCSTLLVANRRRDGRLEWTPPGGVVDYGEASLDALSREVVEETGLTVDGWSEALYRVTVDFPDRYMLLGVEVHLARSWHGDLALDDPDDIVEDARFADPDEARRLLATAPRWVREPVTAWMSGFLPEDPGDGVPHFGYVARGSNPSDLVVERLDAGVD